MVSALEVTDISAYQNKGVLLPADDRNEKNLPSSPGAQYQTNLTPINGSKYWAITLKNLPSAAMLDIQYLGDTGALYENGKLVNDDFYFGKTMQTAVVSTSSAETKKFLLHVIPLTEERKLYLEHSVAKNIKIGEATVQMVQVKVPYRAVLKW